MFHIISLRLHHVHVYAFYTLYKTMWIPVDVKQSKSDLDLRKIKVEILGWQTWLGWDILIWWLDEKEKRKKRISWLLHNLNNFLILIFFLKDHYISEFRLRAPRLPRLIWWTWPTHKNTQCLWVVAEIIRLWAMASRCDCWTCSVTLAYFIILFPYHLTAKF